MAECGGEEYGVGQGGAGVRQGHGQEKGIIGMARLVIDRFTGPYEFLSNFHWFITRTGERTTVEHIYQACKCADPSESYYVLTAKTPGFAKRLGRRAKLVDGWNDNRIPAMLPILRSKFRKGTREAELLLATGDAELIEGNDWGDTFWGMCNGVGENWLGVLLMLVREELSTEVG